jgi:hypothetical protein
LRGYPERHGLPCSSPHFFFAALNSPPPPSAALVNTATGNRGEHVCLGVCVGVHHTDLILAGLIKLGKAPAQDFVCYSPSTNCSKLCPGKAGVGGTRLWVSVPLLQKHWSRVSQQGRSSACGPPSTLYDSQRPSFTPELWFHSNL